MDSIFYTTKKLKNVSDKVRKIAVCVFIVDIKRPRLQGFLSVKFVKEGKEHMAERANNCCA